MPKAMDKSSALAQIRELVQKFRKNEADYLNTKYNETQARTDFITPLLEVFGWDVHNLAQQPNALREVVEEATVEMEDERQSRKPDYELRLARQRKFFVEAKKPSVQIEKEKAPAFQTRRYGFSASLPISILTNFRQLAIYDCHPRPTETDEAHVARTTIVSYTDFESRFDELWETLSRESVYSGSFDRHYSVDTTRHGAQQFDDFFLKQVRSWREKIAIEIHHNSPAISSADLTYISQLFLSRIVFLRICEDRDIESYSMLKDLPEKTKFESLMAELRRADAFYNSGLFSLLDDTKLGIRIGNRILQEIIQELYYPQSPYTFSVVEAEVLSGIYEQFLGEVIQISASGSVEVVKRLDIRESDGVVPTPRFIVDAIVSKTIQPLLVGKQPVDIEKLTVADICCGSGIFLLSAFEFIQNYYLEWYLANNRMDHVGTKIFEVLNNRWQLTFQEKRAILLKHIRGVDIDSNAVEVARFSLLLKLIEGETSEALNEFVDRYRTAALPKLDVTVKAGNSLLSASEWRTTGLPLSSVLQTKIKPFDWRAEFPKEMANGGFDAVVANPPYIRIQHMASYSPEEINFYKNDASPYKTSKVDNFDKYGIFIERALSLIRPTGRLGVIVPHKFMTIHAGRILRGILTSRATMEEIVHFGTKKVFGKTVSNYTSILIMDKRGPATTKVEQVSDLEAWRYGKCGNVTDIDVFSLSDAPWQFASTEAAALFGKIKTKFTLKLGQAADIFVGVQTSADDIFIFKAQSETADTVAFEWNDKKWLIEKSILRPFFLKVHIEPFERPTPNALIIFPYAIEEANGTKSARLFTPAEMKARFPKCLKYLTARRAELEKRKVSGGKKNEMQFYQFGRSQSLALFESPKVIFPALSLSPKYAYDTSDGLVTGGGNGPYYLLRALPSACVSDFYLLALLHHPLSEGFIRTQTSVFGGGYYSHGKQFINELPVPIPALEERKKIENLIAQHFSAQESLKSAGNPHDRTQFQRQIDDLRLQLEESITSLFELTPEELEIAKAIPIPE